MVEMYTFGFMRYSRTPLIQTLVIRIGLALRENLSGILKN